MDKNHIINKICSDNNIETPELNQLEEALNQELAKAEPDFDLVDELTKTILELRNEPEKRLNIAEEIASVKRRGMKRKKIPKLAWIAAAACLILVGRNLSVPDAMGDNLYPSLSKNTQNNIFLDLARSRKKNKEIFSENKDNDPFGIKEYARENEMEVCAPTYLMDGYTVDLSSGMSKSGDRGVLVLFQWDERENYAAHRTYLMIKYDEMYGKDAEEIIINIDESYTLEETLLINGMDAYMLSFFVGSTENKYYTLYFYDEISQGEGILTNMTCGNMSYEQAMRIFKSVC